MAGHRRTLAHSPTYLRVTFGEVPKAERQKMRKQLELGFNPSGDLPPAFLEELHGGHRSSGHKKNGLTGSGGGRNDRDN